MAEASSATESDTDLSASRAYVIPLTRVVLAWLVTLSVLPYAWARVLIVILLTGRPEKRFVFALVAGMATVLLLSFRVGNAPRIRRWISVVGLVVGGSWLAVNSPLVWFGTGPLTPRVPVAIGYVAASLPVLWASWMFFVSWRWRVRAGVLLSLLGCVALFLGLFRVDGMSGDAHVSFAWRSRPAVHDAVATRDGSGGNGAKPVAVVPDPPHDYPQFLGPRRDGVLPDAHVARDWAEHPPRERWRRPVGLGWSGFAVVGDYAFTQEGRGGDECVVCYEAATGNEVWVHADAAEFTSSLGGPGPRATPTVHEGHVFTVGATGLFNCLEAGSGRVVWSVDLLQSHHAENAPHGICASPLVVDDLVLVCPTGERGPSLAAYDRATGRQVWQAGSDRASYSSPLVADLGGVPQILLFDSEAVAGYDIASGNVLWHFPWTNSVKTNVAQPIPNAGGPNQVFVSTGYGQGCVLVRVEPSEGGWSVETLWSNKGLKTKFCTAVVHGGYVYGLDDGILACEELATGKQLWKRGRYGHGQLLLAGDVLIVQAENGEVVLVAADPAGLNELGRIAALAGKTWNTPALAGRFLLVRNDHEAACYELSLADE